MAGAEKENNWSESVDYPRWVVDWLSEAGTKGKRGKDIYAGRHHNKFKNLTGSE